MLGISKKSITFVIVIKNYKINIGMKRILVAEDNDSNWTLMTYVLKRNYEPVRALNGEEAVKMALTGGYALVIMDLKMPVMDGLEATRTIRALDREDASEIPIISLTANAFDEDVQRSLQAGLNAHLSKPVEPDALYATLEGFVKH